MSMPAPKRDPKSGRWRFRKAVPLDLRDRVGKLEVVKWLGTDAKAAKDQNAALHLEWDRRFADLRAGVVTVGPREAADLAGRWYRWFTARWENEGLTSPQGWLLSLEQLDDLISAGGDAEGEVEDTPDFVTTEASILPPHVAAFLRDRGQVTEFLLEQGATLDVDGMNAFLAALRTEFYPAHLLLARRAGGDFGRDDHLDKLPTARPAKGAGGDRQSITGLAEDYFAARKTLGQSNEAELRWRPVVAALVAFLEHDVAADVTTADLVRWKDDLLKTHAPKTVRDSDLASIRTIYGWGVENLRVAENPAKGVKVRVPTKRRTRDPGFTDAEAVTVLKAAASYVASERENEQTAAAKRWACWLCAFTGSRIAEVTQLRKEDVRVENGIHFIDITPDAGSVKTGQFRHVPLHPQLVDMGFLRFVERSPAGPLFFPATRKGGQRHPSKAVSGLLAAWVRDLGVKDTEVDPNHGWRHRFKTVAREVGMDPDVRDAIQGHRPRTAGETYGSISLVVKKRAIELLPRVALADASGGTG